MTDFANHTLILSLHYLVKCSSEVCKIQLVMSTFFLMLHGRQKLKLANVSWRY